jgi:hypothetical protein
VNGVQATVTATNLVRRDERAITNALKIRYTPFAADGGEGGDSSMSMAAPNWEGQQRSSRVVRGMVRLFGQ